ncbi:hypothetical protein OEB99_05240 [Actinotalea sp. M2MS4P-6]|uniref:hypothetical protein n=1 Tax=Actinotalea sp. M2MS4P-6 TaxID=2983762 RepID=UPI0021E3EDBF|nr:hypothetical protein [Actinotalea sp. M2MS4P-6]MCV2393707.1 hypothetical protein [Actinotalea sp. M2MS4P-6]
MFYEGLENPKWVRPLLGLGAFANPPEPLITDDGYIRDVYWPEISYLVRVAPEAPDDVVDVLLTLGDTNNAWVKRALFEIGTRIPPSAGARLKPVLKQWMKTGFGWRTDPRRLVDFAITLLEGGEARTGRWLANYLFTPMPPTTDDPYLRKPELALDEYWYQTELPRLLPALGDDAVKALTGWLAKYIQLAGYADSGHDFSGMIRPSVKSRGDTYPSPEHALVDALRDVGVTAMVADPERTSRTLLGSGTQLLRKIAMFTVAEAIRQQVAAGSDSHGLVDVAQRLLGDPSSADEHLLIEYAELAQQVARINTDALAVISDVIDHAHAEDLRWMAARQVDEDATAEEIMAEAKEGADRSKHTWLSAIGAEALPPRLQTELAELDATFGVVGEPPTPLGVITTWSGPNPHSTQDQMAAMSPTELVEHLASWHDTGRGWGPEPSHEGQGRELAALLTTNPLALSGVSDLVQRLRPTYLRAILRGWQAALKAGVALEWSPVADLVRDVLHHSNESPFPAEGGDMDDDRDFRGAKTAAVGLLEDLVKDVGAAEIPEAALIAFADLIIEDAADEQAWVEYDQYESGEGSWDPLTVSLNWQWPKRLRALIHLATRAGIRPWTARALDAIERELRRPDRHGAGSAVVGESLGRLLGSHPDWVRGRSSDLFGGEAGLSENQQIALTTAIATHYYRRELYELLSGALVAAISLGDRLVSGWRTEAAPAQRIGEWAINALIFGDATFEDAVVDSFFANASAAVRGGALDRVAWSLFRANRVDDSIRDRFANLWDDRVRHVREHPDDKAELRGFYWLAKGRTFAVEWWLPRLREALELEPEIGTQRYMIGRELARASSVAPSDALAALRLLLAVPEESGAVSLELVDNAVPVIIANALSGGDPGLRNAAEMYMNELGAKGYLALEAEVQAVLRGELRVEETED